MNVKVVLSLQIVLVTMVLGSPTAQSQRGYELQAPEFGVSEVFSIPTVPTVPVVTLDQLYSTPKREETTTTASVKKLYEPPREGSLREAVVARTPATPPAMVGMPYEFEWSVNDIESGNQYSHAESSDGILTQGEYRVLLPDGRTQVVTFFDRGNGYEAQVTYE